MPIECNVLRRGRRNRRECRSLLCFNARFRQVIERERLAGESGPIVDLARELHHVVVKTESEGQQNEHEQTESEHLQRVTTGSGSPARARSAGATIPPTVRHRSLSQGSPRPRQMDVVR